MQHHRHHHQLKPVPNGVNFLPIFGDAFFIFVFISCVSCRSFFFVSLLLLRIKPTDHIERYYSDAGAFWQLETADVIGNGLGAAMDSA